MRELAAEADNVGAEFWALGGETRMVDGVRCVRNRSVPLVGDCNFVSGLIGEDPAELARTLAKASEWIRSPRVRVCVGPDTAAPTEAALLLAGWRAAGPRLDLVLTGACPRPESPGAAIRPATTEADWRRIAAMFRLDHEEEDRKDGRRPRTRGETEQAILARRMKTPDVRYWIAWDGGAPAGFFSSWPRDGGTAMVEDLFVHPAHRGRGIAGALLHHAVTDARSQGAEAVLIRADADDWPKDFYHRRGFRPVAAPRCYSPPAGHQAGAARGG
ncbi:GNAT family N-acetyltransferase [Allosalinactinospora lopnorensis]|uniref:GNAT family N-acetyltransferase n=1 Tax=Allosalinactinospora lopnorensis TaxID=1352348 RepID=UPI00138EE3AB|nr:GNAT family N-acetyltransferase [Allosalinactinospora lopnorensis]